MYAALAASLAPSAFLATPALARQTQEKPPDPPDELWHDTAEFSFVATSGNSETQTLGFKDKLWRKWGPHAFELNAGGVRVETTDVSRTAFGTSGDFEVVENEDSEVTAENYYLNGRYDRKITDQFFWFAGVGWDRNEFAGIENRYSGVGGVGNIWKDTEHLKFRTDYAATYTKQEDVLENPDPDFDDTFVGLRVSWAYSHQFFASTVYTNDFAVDENLVETSDYRASMINAVSVAINKRLALKVSHQILYDHEPSFEEVDLFDTPGGTLIGTVAVQLDEVDTIFNTSLVVNF